MDCRLVGTGPGPLSVSIAPAHSAATMTRTASTSGCETRVLAAASVPAIVPVTVVIGSVRNDVAKGFTLERA